MSPPMLDPALEAYIEAHTTPPDPYLAALAEETRASLSSPQMLTGTVEGRLLEALVWVGQPRLVLELGTYSGYSALSMAAALPPGGRIVTCEVSTEHADFAQRHIDASPHADRIELRRGPALDTIAALDGPFDLVFIDADKPNYPNYYEAVVPKLAAHGLIVVDNTLWSGNVVGEEDQSDYTVAMRAFNDRVRGDERVVCVMLSVRDGVTLIRRRGAVAT
jgi:caffeoyl-CoA O-methyltransferase